jgi:hypothetical protein
MGAGVNRILALAYREADILLSNQGRDISFHHFAVAQISLRNERRVVSSEQFQGLRKAMRDEFSKTMKAAQRQANQIVSKKQADISKLYGEPTALSLSEVLQLEVFDDTDTSIGTLGTAKRISQTPGRRVEETIIFSTISILLKGKVINLSIHAPYKSSHDVNLVKKTSNQWIKAIRISN